MSSPEWLIVGKVVGAFGVKGWLKVRSFTQPDEAILDYQPWHLSWSNGGDLVEQEFVVSQANVTDKGLLVEFEQALTREQAQALKNAVIEVRKNQLPELESGEFYWHQLVGCRVNEADGSDFGVVTGLLETGANDVLVVRGDDKAIDTRERLIPYLPEQVVKSVNLDRRLIVVDWDSQF